MDELKKIILAGIGTVAITYEKTTKLIDDMVSKGRITTKEAVELSEELKRNVKDTIKPKEDNSNIVTKAELIELINKMNFVTKEDLQLLQFKVDSLEKIINEKTKE